MLNSLVCPDVRQLNPSSHCGKVSTGRPPVGSQRAGKSGQGRDSAVGGGRDRSFSILPRCLPVALALCVAVASVTVAGWLSRQPSVGPFLLCSVQSLPRWSQGQVVDLLRNCYFSPGRLCLWICVSELQFQNV